MEEHRAVWNDVNEPSAAAPLTTDAETDVVVIGAGITGVTAALLLRRQGLRVTVLERHRAGDGDTGGTSAHVSAQLDDPYRALHQGRTDEQMKLLARAARHAIDRIEELSATSELPAQFTRCPGFLYTEKEAGRTALREEADLLTVLGFEASFLDQAPLPYLTRGAVRVERQARFHPRAYVLGLLRRARAEGVVLHEDTAVASFEHGEPCVVETARGARVRARHVVFAAHAPLTLLSLQTRLSHYASYVIAFPTTSAPPVVDGLFCDDEDPYHYVRLSTHGGTPLWIVGGADHRLGQEPDTNRPYDQLLAWAAQRFGVATARPTARWSSQVFESSDGLPMLGALASTPHLWVATGFGGNGLTWGTLGAELITDGILGRTNPFTELFSPNRTLDTTALPTWLSDQAAVARCYLGDLPKLLDGDSLDAIKLGEGRVLRHGLQMVAAHRDERGKLRVLHARCPHLGALVRFNNAEKTWDCPCHGSRFDLDGQVLTGPALTPLTPVDVKGT